MSGVPGGRPPGLVRRRRRSRPAGGKRAWWLPGLHRAVPSTPLDERYEVVPSTLTDPAGSSPGQIASRSWTPNRGTGYSSPPTGGLSRSGSATTGSSPATGAAAGWCRACRRWPARPRCCGCARRSATPTGRRPARPRTATWTPPATARKARGPRCACSTSPRRRSTARTTGWPTPPSGSSTTCSTTRPTGRISASRSAANGRRSAPTTRRSRPPSPTALARPGATGPAGCARWCRTTT